MFKITSNEVLSTNQQTFEPYPSHPWLLQISFLAPCYTGLYCLWEYRRRRRNSFITSPTKNEMPIAETATILVSRYLRICTRQPCRIATACVCVHVWNKRLKNLQFQAPCATACVCVCVCVCANLFVDHIHVQTSSTFGTGLIYATRQRIHDRRIEARN